MARRPVTCCSPCARRRARSSIGTTRAGSASRAGPPATTITLQARNGDGVVISRGEDFLARGRPTAASGRRAGSARPTSTRRSGVRSPPSRAATETMMGWWIEFDHPHQLMRYSSLTNLRAALRDRRTAQPTTRGLACIRTATATSTSACRSRTRSSTAATTNGASACGLATRRRSATAQLNYPISENPERLRDLPDPGERNARPLSISGRGYAKIGAGINSMGHRVCLGSQWRRTSGRSWPALFLAVFHPS